MLGFSLSVFIEAYQCFLPTRVADVNVRPVARRLRTDGLPLLPLSDRHVSDNVPAGRGDRRGCNHQCHSDHESRAEQHLHAVVTDNEIGTTCGVAVDRTSQHSNPEQPKFESALGDTQATSSHSSIRSLRLPRPACSTPSPGLKPRATRKRRTLRVIAGNTAKAGDVRLSIGANVSGNFAC